MKRFLRWTAIGCPGVVAGYAANWATIRFARTRIRRLRVAPGYSGRASTGAPTFFPAEKIVIDGRTHLFVDGGVTTYNNPAFQLFLMATAEPYNLNWSTGKEKMLLVSVGTGSGANAKSKLSPHELHLLYNASSIPAALMFAALNEQDFLCRVLGSAWSVVGSIARLKI